ncbi:protein shisa-7-like [Brachionichthys hirsutus]|uniref:protein shisa-7-like n=1 Tax=Brachionichthys hirsutus TaxID=412623 RepID=UPI0036052B33
MKAAAFPVSSVLLLSSCLAVSTLSIATETLRTPAVGRSPAAAGTTWTALLLLTGYKPPPTAAKAGPKAAQVGGGDGPAVAAELPPKPLPQTMLPRNMTADALRPPLGAAQVAPPPRQLVDADVCRGYYDVMGHFDSTFNCSRGSYVYCCGTCFYRFCCEHRRSRLDQQACSNYKSPVWADPQGPGTEAPGDTPGPGFETLQQHDGSTAYVIGGVISFTLVAAVGVRIAFSKVARRARNREVNVPRSLVDILRHQSSPAPQGDGNSCAMLAPTAADGRMSKKLYAPAVQSKDNRSE